MRVKSNVRKSVCAKHVAQNSSPSANPLVWLDREPPGLRPAAFFFYQTFLKNFFIKRASHRAMASGSQS
jgi:hypothetical protein